MIESERKQRELPEFFLEILGKQEIFFIVLEKIKNRIIGKMMKKNSYAPPESFPVPNLCGIIADAIVEAIRDSGKEARVVYGHHFDGDKFNKYHYWAEVKDKDNKIFVVDAAYGQFDAKYKNKMISYNVEELKDYNLREYVEGDMPKLVTDTGTLEILKQGKGRLPSIKERWTDDMVGLYNQLVKSLKDSK